MATFPLITEDMTSVWVDFWNTTLADWMNALGSGELSWPSKFTLNGRIIQTESDGLEPTVTASPTLAILLKSGSEWVVDGTYHLLDEDIQISDLSPNFTGWIVPTAIYDDDTESWVWGHTEHATRPDDGAGVACKVVTLNDRVSVLTTTEDECDLIPTLPVLKNRITNGGEGGVSIEYLSQLKYSPSDPRTATTVIEEKIAEALATALDSSEAGGVKQSPTDVDQLTSIVLGLVRGIREVYPDSVRFLSIGAARPGIAGTESSPDTDVYDLGGTLPEDASNRVYDPS